MPNKENKSALPFKFSISEFSGSLGDLGTLLPIASAMILINGLSPTTVFLWIGIFYILAGTFYRLPIPVQPLKVVGALAIASPVQFTPEIIAASGILFGTIMLFLSFSGLMDRLSKLFTKPVIRGIQLGLGMILFKKGAVLFASDELFLNHTKEITAGFSANLIIGVFAFLVVLFFLNNKKYPAALMVIILGIIVGVSVNIATDVSKLMSVSIGPSSMKFFTPSLSDYTTALLLLVIPQIPLTIGNAAIGTADTACSLFPERSETERSTPANFAMTMGIVNFFAGFMGAMPMCHGSGGLAAHYRFGARTGGSNLMIGIIFIIAALLFGSSSFLLISLLPSSVLGTLLLFAGIELALLVKDVNEKGDLFVTILVAGIGLFSTNMAYAFIAGIIVHTIIRKAKIKF